MTESTDLPTHPVFDEYAGFGKCVLTNDNRKMS